MDHITLYTLAHTVNLECFKDKFVYTECTMEGADQVFDFFFV